MAELLFYEKVTILDREKHRTLRLKALGDHRYAAKAHAIPLMAAEYVEASREYPIVFARTPEGKMLSLALTGTQQGENLYLDADGRWDARYIPAFVRRYPFVFAETGPDQLTACMDESFPGFSQTEGEALFRDNGESTPFMQGYFDLLTECQRQTVLTESFLKKLEASGVLMEAQMRAETPDGRCAQLQGVLVVDSNKFQGLPPETLKEWFLSGELGLVYAHLFSLGNIVELARRMPLTGRPD